MDTLVRISNLVTVGNIGTVLSVAGFIVLGYYNLRKLIAKQQAEFKAYVATLTVHQTAQLQAATDAQTSRIEACIHQTPGHPENLEEKKDVPS